MPGGDHISTNVLSIMKVFILITVEALSWNKKYSSYSLESEGTNCSIRAHAQIVFKISKNKQTKQNKKVLLMI